jgi:glycosyltransferase involved in cell wall biosynthesis
MAKQWTWENACEKVAEVYREALTPQPPTVGIVIPVYNKTDQQIRRALESAIHQTYNPISRIVIVDDGSDNSDIAQNVVDNVECGERDIVLLRQGNSGVANARNNGVTACGDVKYVCCLDSDDGIEERFIETCVNALESDRSLGIAYTSLYYITPDGREGISDWPGGWDYDAHLRRQNQVPTCCVYRKEMWERLGGYRQRYAPTGAGEEDAEFFLRAGAYGWKGAKVSQEPLFVYSWQSGIVSGNKQHAVTDWTGWHPWAGDGQHPFASYATPKNELSHPVRQYDEPAISVVIPVGPDHAKLVVNALDSLEAQTFRKWEVIVVDDTDFSPPEQWGKLLKAYPYIQYVSTLKLESAGAGTARNEGAEIARAPFLLFLDADDWLYPECLERMVAAWNEHQRIIYSDYVGKAIVSPGDLAEDLRQRVYTFNERTGEAVIGYRAFDYDCELAQSQPQGERPYIWTNVTSLIPRAWHNGINGFDESLSSWEDVDYHWRLAKAGHCYHRIESELMVYNFHYGHRREQGRQTYQNLLQYLREKHRDHSKANHKQKPLTTPTLSKFAIWVKVANIKLPVLQCLMRQSLAGICCDGVKTRRYGR